MKRLETLKKYRDMTETEMIAEVKSAKNVYTKAALSVQAGKEDNHSSVSKQRKDIARLSTIISEKRYGVNNDK